MEGEVLGGDKVVAEKGDTAERGVREGLGLCEAAEDVVGEVPVGTYEARDEPLRAVDRLRREGVVGDEGSEMLDALCRVRRRSRRRWNARAVSGQSQCSLGSMG